MRTPPAVAATFAAWAVALCLAASCGAPQPTSSSTASTEPPPYTPVVDMLTLMTEFVDPTADVVWQSVAINITREGEEHKRPQTDEEWTDVRRHALMLAEAGNLLMLPGRARDNGQWMTMSRALITAANKALDAARAQDADALLQIGGEIFDTCENCHRQYIPNYEG